MPYAPLGRAIMGGMLAATFLTLLIVPLFYTMFDDLRIQVASQVQSVFSYIKPGSRVSDSTRSLSCQRGDR